jgi:glucose-1-phosphate cytidylyltransferase
MKVVLFCGGLGLRLQDGTTRVPKPLISVGDQPILMHLMKYYAHFGHKDFILCLGHNARAFKEYFLEYNEALQNDFVLAGGGRVEVFKRDTDDWRITFVDTGRSSLIGERLRRVRPHIGDDEAFLANYADGLSDLPLDQYVEYFSERDKKACFVTVPAPHTFHIVHADGDDRVTKLEHVGQSPVRINAGFFILRREIFDYLHPGEELVLEPFQRLIDEGQLLAYPYDGFWRNMDTFKDKVELEEIIHAGNPPWQLWSRPD